MRMALEEVPIRDLLGAAVEAVLPQAAAKHVPIESAYEDDLGTLQGDRDRLQQVVSNILVNAVKFTPSGGRVRLEAHSTEKGLTLYVVDTGLGMTREFLPRVFDRFAKLDQSLKRTSGLGVGLALAKEIVTAHGGVIGVHSDGIGLGTTVMVHLPRVPRGLGREASSRS